MSFSADYPIITHTCKVTKQTRRWHARCLECNAPIYSCPPDTAASINHGRVICNHCHDIIGACVNAMLDDELSEILTNIPIPV